MITSRSFGARRTRRIRPWPLPDRSSLPLAWVAGVLMAWPGLAFAQPEATGGGANHEDASQAERGGTENADEPAADPGTLRVIVFAGDEPIPGAQVRAGGKSATTNQHGAAELQLPPGVHDVQVSFEVKPEERASETQQAQGTQRVGIASNETSEAIVVLHAVGQPLAWDLEDFTPKELKAQRQAQQATEFGTIAGRVTSMEDSTPVKGARLFVRGVDVEGTTDESGEFEIANVPVGTHSVSVIHPEYSTLSRADVVVEKDATTEIDMVVTPVSVRLDDFVVTAPHLEGSVAGLMDERRESAGVSDAIGREDISKMPASDAASAAQRVVGATIVGGRFVYVRGLGERYSNALLNGGPLPSPEPDQATVPLDLFPAQILESIDIAKTFTPDMPGNFAGGSVRIKTRGVPEELMVNVGLSLGWDSQSSFNRGYTYPGGKFDALGFDDGSRARPSGLPDYALRRGSTKPDGSMLGSDELVQWGRALNTPMAVEKNTIPPNMSGSLAVGNGWQFGKGRLFGTLASLVYSRSFELRTEERRTFQKTSDEDLQPLTDFEVDLYNASVRWGAFVTNMLELSEDHTIQLHLMHSQLADDITRMTEGFSRNLTTDIHTSRLEFASRGLTSGQLQGEHTLDPLNEAVFEWRGFASLASRNQPDTRDVVWRRNAVTGESGYFDSEASGRHFFSNQSEIARGGSVDWTQPITDGFFGSKLKFGSMINAKKRDFQSRRLTLRRASGALGGALVCGSDFDPSVCPADLFVDENVGELLALTETPQDGDNYDAILNVYAGYGMLEMSFGDHWRLSGGVRLEQTVQEIIALTPGGETVEEKSSSLSVLDILPAGSIIYSPIESVNIRAAGSRTLARPQLRELAPFTFADFFGGVAVQGNHNLVLTDIINGDLRFEWYPTPREVVAVSGFAKKFTNPIEPVFQPVSENLLISYQNTPGARLFGIEAEARKTLDFIHEKLYGLTIIGSVMWARSQIELEQTGNMTLTNTERPMVYQAPYVVNLSLDYENDHGTQARILYNVSGPQIVEVGTDLLEDAYLQPRHMLDLTASQRIKENFKIQFTVTNILNSEYLVTVGKKPGENNIRRRYREGIELSLGASYSY